MTACVTVVGSAIPMAFIVLLCSFIEQIIEHVGESTVRGNVPILIGVHHLVCTLDAQSHIPTRKACTGVWTSCGHYYVLSLEEVLTYFWI